MAGFDGMPMGGMPMAGGMPMGMEGMSGGEVFSGGMPMGQPGGNCPSCQAGQQQQFGGYPMAMNQQSFAPSQSFAPNGVAMVQGGEYAGGQPTYQQQSYGPGVSAYPTQMPGQGGFQGQPQAGQTWMAPQGGPGATAPLLGQPNPVRQTAPPIQSPSPIPPSGSGAALPFGAFPGTAPASAVAPAHAFGGEDFAPARLRFQVPAGAVVFVDGQKVDGTGPVRKFHTPTLPRGRTFFYEFRAEFEVNGVKVVEEKVLPVCAGDELNETFAKLASAAK